jgi:hypothetical protein
MKLEIEMTNTQAADSNVEAEPRDVKDVAENKISSASDKDVLGDSALDGVSGGTWPFNTLATASYISSGKGG